MIDAIKNDLWKQFGASIDMLRNAIMQWPDEYWDSRKRFFYVAYHCLIFLDYYLTIPPKAFSSPLPFTFAESDLVSDEVVDDIIPDRIYSKIELIDYLQSCREKCHALIRALTEEKLKERWIEVDGRMNYSVLEILLYNMRHVQHHAAQLNLFLRQGINNAPDWVSRTEDEL